MNVIILSIHTISKVYKISCLPSKLEYGLVVTAIVTDPPQCLLDHISEPGKGINQFYSNQAFTVFFENLNISEKNNEIV